MKKPTLKQLSVGHVERVTVQEDHLFRTEVELYKEPACDVFQVRGFRYVKGSSSTDRLFWESAHTLDEAFEIFKEKARKLVDVA